MFAVRLLAVVAIMLECVASSPTVKRLNGSSSAFHVCGNYCGPGWCNGGWTPEEDCDDHVDPETWSSTGPSCADVCCRAHDHCCGHEPPYSSCNTQIVDCLSNCDAASLTCTIDGVPVPAGGIEAAMDIVENWCCGSPCSQPVSNLTKT